MKKYPLSQKEFDNIYSKVPRLCVDLIIVKGKKILLTKRSIPPFKGLWHLPGGGVFHRENVHKAIKRIAKRELGIDVNPGKLAGYFEALHDGPNRHSIALEFLCNAINKKQKFSISEASEYDFFAKVPKNTLPNQRKFLSRNWKKIVN